MSRLLLVCFFLSSLALCAQAEDRDGTKIPVKSGHKVHIIYYVTGLGEQSEPEAIVQSVKKLETVSSVGVNTDRGYVKVVFDSHQLSYHQVAQAIMDAGAQFGKDYDPRVVISVPDYPRKDVTPKINAVFANPKFKQWIKIEAIDSEKGLFFVHFLPLKDLTLRDGARTPGFNGGYLTHPIHLAPPEGMALRFKYFSDDSPEIPVAGKKADSSTAQ